MKNQITIQMIEAEISEINGAIALLNPEFIYFKNTQQILRSDKTEAAYFNNIDYYYVLFIERNDIFSKFIEEKILLYELDYKSVMGYLQIFHDLRTYKSHRIDMNLQRGKNIVKHVKKWYFDHVGTQNPSVEEKISCIPILDGMAYLILTNIHKCLEKINKDSRKISLISEMELVQKKYLPDYIIMEAAGKVIKNMQIQVDTYKFVKKFGAQIKKKMENRISTNKEERDEILKLCIENVLMENKIGLCPLSYNQIEEVYQGRTQKELGDLKKRAIQISDANMFLTAENILQILLKENPLD